MSGGIEPFILIMLALLLFAVAAAITGIIESKIQLMEEISHALSELSTEMQNH